MTTPQINNYIHGVRKEPTVTSSTASSHIPVISPSTSKVIANVYKSNKDDVQEAMESSKKAFEEDV